MTEADYLASVTQPTRMYRFVSGSLSRPVSVTRCRLLHAGCCRLFAGDLTPALAHALTVLEDHARGHADDDQFAAASELVWDVERRLADRPAGEEWGFPVAVRAVAAAFHPDVRGATVLMAWALSTLTTGRADSARGQAATHARRAACDLVRDVAGNPFRPWQQIPSWLGGGVVQPDGAAVRPSDTARTLAAVIDRGRYYERLPILADALEEAGVTDTALLAHCRADAGHHPGCWAVELVLGRG